MKQKAIFAYLSALIITFSGCYQQGVESISLSIPIIIKYDSISSASGIISLKEKLFIVGDDSPFLFQINNSFEIVEKLKLSNMDSVINGRVPGKIKADFECMGNIDESTLLILSSGSLSPGRDTAYLVMIDDTIRFKSMSMRPVYEKIKKKAGIKVYDEINIEALAITVDSIYIFNRGNTNKSFIAVVGKNDFLDYYLHESDLPYVSIHTFVLPRHNDVIAGFSGACVVPDGSGLFFTASMEDTPDQLSDGEIIGSFVGYIPFRSITQGNYLTQLLMNEKQELLRKKLEGITVIKKGINKNKTYDVITAVDSDDGTSDLILFTISIN